DQTTVSGLEAGPDAGSALGSGRLQLARCKRRVTSMSMPTLVKTTQDGRKLEVIGLAICLDRQLEAFELIEVKLHPNKRAIWKVLPEATHLAGRVALTREEADIIFRDLKEAE